MYNEEPNVRLEIREVVGGFQSYFILYATESLVKDKPKTKCIYKFIQLVRTHSQTLLAIRE